MKYLLSFCLLVGALQAFGGGSSTVGIGNPAAQNCVKLGGKTTLVKNQDGSEFGVCTLGKRAIIEEWTLFRIKNGNFNLAAEELFTPSINPPTVAGRGSLVNPASFNCDKKGGKLVLVQDQKGSQLGLCQFKDSSMIEEWTLFRTALSQENKKLVQAFKRKK